MTIHLPEHLERYVHDQVGAGHFRSEDDVIRDALERHRQAHQPPAAAPATTDPLLGSMRDDAELMDEIVAEAYRRRMTEAEFKRHLLQTGRISSLPTPADPATRPAFQPITLEGEPLSETIIRERR
jgi:Arc/MetJ-type ribon-helix-helix transcriptional regulator